MFLFSLSNLYPLSRCDSCQNLNLELLLSVGIVKLVVEAEETAPGQARQLLQRSRQENVAGISSQAIIELVETIMVYKLTTLSREEIEVMLGLGDLKQTRVYQEALEEGRQEGRQEGQQELIENLLKARFGSLDEALSRVVAVLEMPSAEFTPLLLQLSREERIDRFTQDK